MKYFIYEREKTYEPIEVALNKDIETEISYLRENFKCTGDYLLHHASTETTKIYLEGFGKDEIAEMTNGLLASLLIL